MASAGVITAWPGQSPRDQFARPGTRLRQQRLHALSGQLQVDERRTVANSALLSLGSGHVLHSKPKKLPPVVKPEGDQSAEAWSCPGESLDVVNPHLGKHPLVGYRLPEQLKQAAPATPSSAVVTPSSARSPERRSKKDTSTPRRRKADNLTHVETLEESFKFHIKVLAGSGDTFGVDELVHFLEQCQLLDHWLTERRVRLFWTTFFEGHPDGNPQQIAYPDFAGFLAWAADLKGWSWSALTEQVIMYFRQNSDKSAAMMWRLEVVFETFAKTEPDVLRDVEFVALCSACGLCERPRFDIADIYLLFAELGVTSVDFAGYMKMIGLAGKRMGIGNQSFRRIADAADTLDSEPFVIMRVRLALKQAASTMGGIDWQKMFYEVDLDGDGTMSWEEFRSLARVRMKLVNTSDWALRMMFRKVDRESKGRVSLQELVRFIADGVDAHRSRRRTSQEALASLDLAKRS
eukprot:CAMPEP_0178441528 /NCGR_PEP_ID=MMETSP0689_2-20121128/37520_1 /TAXON_ID=160604 /ORGANISM="Amphidinium massartii, Strain CS-259" /LENGTH=462 /DNA_ID=CAMNT_0020064695 /DNA_START=24 /DNA_END=1409 /DNA_ORIENTATION=+